MFLADRLRRVTKEDVRNLTTWGIGITLFAAAMLLLLWNYVVVTILPGHVGVLYSWLQDGTRVGRTYSEGVAIKWPWNRIYIIETRVQTQDYQVIVLSQESMYLALDISILSQVRPEAAGRLIREFGPDYAERIIRPLTIGTVRELAAHHDSHTLYTLEYRDLEQQIRDKMAASSYSQLVDFQQVVIRKILIPEIVSEAIEDKLAQQQKAAAYTFRLEQERQEAERKRIEAIGIQNFYSVVSAALTPNLLTWRGIEATVALAQSPNAKTVVVGGGRNQMPLILGGDIQNLPPPASIPPVASTAKPLPEWRKLPSLFPAVNSRGSPNTGAAPPPNDDPPTPPKPDAQAQPQPGPFATVDYPVPHKGDGTETKSAPLPSADANSLRPATPDNGLRNAPPVKEGTRGTPPQPRAPSATGQPLGLAP